MIYNYSFYERAQEDYENALNWYLRKSEKVAWDFITSVDKTLELICHNPYRWRNEYKNYFELSLQNSPTLLFIQLIKKKNNYCNVCLSSKKES